jgi:hypothetical protein
MPEHAPDFAAIFRRLERGLLARRLAAIEPVLRIEIGALVAIGLAVLFWQTRLRLDNAGFAHGPLAAAGESAASLAFCAILGGATAGARHATRLRTGFPGPPWLALPIPARAIAGHLARTSRALAWWTALPAAAILLAGAGIVPGPISAALAFGFPVALDLAARAGCAIAFRAALARTAPRAGVEPLVRVLAAAARGDRAVRLGAARWQSGGPFSAFLRKDLLLAGRPGPARARLLPPLAFAALALLAWSIPIAPDAVPAVAMGLALLAAAGVASWIIALAASDPYPVLRSLPLGVGVVWGARVVWAALAAVTLAAGQAAAAGLTGAHAAPGTFAVVALPALAIGVLGANYAITLFPRADLADRILAVALGFSLAASLMIFYLGWFALLAALAHSARRLRGWARRGAA